MSIIQFTAKFQIAKVTLNFFNIPNIIQKIIFIFKKITLATSLLLYTREIKDD